MAGGNRVREKQDMKELIDLYNVDRERTGMTAVRGEDLPEGTFRMVVHVCIFNSKGEMRLIDG